MDVACGCCLLARPGEVHAGFGSAGRQTLTCCAPPSLPVLPRRRRPCSSGPWRLHAVAHDYSQAGGSPDQPVSRPACAAPQVTAAQFWAVEATRCGSPTTTSRETVQSGRASRRQGARYVMQPCNIPSRQLCCVRLAVLSLGADHVRLASQTCCATSYLLPAPCHTSPAARSLPCLTCCLLCTMPVWAAYQVRHLKGSWRVLLPNQHNSEVKICATSRLVEHVIGSSDRDRGWWQWQAQGR